MKSIPPYEPLKSGADIVEQQRREIAAAKAMLRQVAKPTKYSVRALSRMTLGRGALITAIRYHGG